MPDGWAWCRVGSITQFIRNGANIKQDKEAQGYPITRIETISNGEINTEKFGYANIFELEKFEKYLLHIDDILMSHINSPVHLGKSAIYDGNYETPIIHGMNLLCIRLVEKSSSYYLLYAFRTSLFKDFVWENMKQAVNQASITTASISSFLLPLAPFNEQRRITKTIKQYTNLIDRIENDKTNLQQILSVTKSKILDLAIRGKLVPQDPNDEPASVLLERIRAEKEELIKQGKIKRDKKESVIFKGDDNSYYEKIGNKLENIDNIIPFEIPDSWQWCRGYSCFAGMESEKPSGEFFDYIDIDAIDNHLHRIKKTKRMLVSNAPSRASRVVKTGSVLFSLVRPYLENIALIDEKYENSIASTGFYVCNSSGVLYPEYMFCLMISGYVVNGLNQFMKGDNSPSISKDNIENWLYPIPPFNEQKIICNKIKRLFSEIEAIEKSLS